MPYTNALNNGSLPASVAVLAARTSRKWATSRCIKRARCYHLARSASAVAFSWFPDLLENDFVDEIPPLSSAIAFDNDDMSINSSDSDDSSLEDGASIDDLIYNVSSRKFGVKNLRQKQIDATKKIIFELDSNGKLLLVDRTGGGKSHTLRIVASIVGGVILIIIPLLSLTADQLQKMEEACKKFGSVEIHHMDEILSSKFVVDELIPRIVSLPVDTSSTIFIFSSPQYLATNPTFINALVQSHSRRTLRLVAIDEVHLFVQHGISFREVIRMLTTRLFKRIFPTAVHSYHPLFLTMTATMTEKYVKELERLTCVKFNECSRLWSSFSEFRQRNISMIFEASYDVGQRGIPELIGELKSDNRTCACVFVNFRSESYKWLGVLETKLDADSSPIDVLHVHGHLDKNEKFSFIRLFSAKQRLGFLNPRILVATSAANTGIDNHFVVSILRIGFPRDLLTLLQERGRACRVDGMTGSFRMFANFTSFVKLLLSLLNPINNDTDKEDNSIDGCNSVIASKTRKTIIDKSTPKRGRSKSPTPASKTKSPCSDLSLEQKFNLRDDQHNNLLDVLRFFCLDMGCQHTLAEWYLSHGILSFPPEIILPCVSACCICNGKWNKYFLTVYRSSVIAFLQSSLFSDKMPMVIDIEAPESIVDILWHSRDWISLIFDRVTIQKYNVSCLFLQLIAVKIIVAERKGNEVHWIMNRDADDKHVFEDNKVWQGINYFKETRKRMFKSRK